MAFTARLSGEAAGADGEGLIEGGGWAVGDVVPAGSGTIIVTQPEHAAKIIARQARAAAVLRKPKSI